MTTSLSETIVICQNQTIAWPIAFHNVVTSDRPPCLDEVYLIAYLYGDVEMQEAHIFEKSQIGRDMFWPLLDGFYLRDDV